MTKAPSDYTRCFFISKLSNKRVERVEDVVNIGDRVEVEVIKKDEKGRIDLKLVKKL